MSTIDIASPLPGSAKIWGTLRQSDGLAVEIAGLTGLAGLGDQVRIGDRLTGARGEIIRINQSTVSAILTEPMPGLVAGQRAWLISDPTPQPSSAWLGHVIDADGRSLEGSTIPLEPRTRPMGSSRQPTGFRRAFGARLHTGLAAFDTMLPLCRGQRLGVFAGSGVGKSHLIGNLAAGVEADFAVIGLIGERNREVSDFVRTLRETGRMDRAVVIAATSDQSALIKRRASELVLKTAEYFRDRGNHVLCLFDSVTRFAEAHREIALAAGEAPALRAFPPSTAAAIAGLCERAGPGSDGDAGGDITAVFSVLVAGSDMDEPVSDMVRAVLDGHVILDRAIAERGRFPAIDLRRSVSRSAPGAWTSDEEAAAVKARQLIAAFEEAAPMIQAGLYAAGADPVLDEAVQLWPELERFVGTVDPSAPEGAHFQRLRELLSLPELQPDPEQQNVG